MGLEPTTFELEVQHASPLRHGGDGDVVCFSALHVAALKCIALFEVSKQLQSTGVSGFPKTTSENSSKLIYFLLLQLTPWRNGSASDSRSEGCVFKSRRGHS